MQGAEVATEAAERPGRGGAERAAPGAVGEVAQGDLHGLALQLPLGRDQPLQRVLPPGEVAARHPDPRGARTRDIGQAQDDVCVAAAARHVDDGQVDLVARAETAGALSHRIVDVAVDERLFAPEGGPVRPLQPGQDAADHQVVCPRARPARHLDKPVGAALVEHRGQRPQVRGPDRLRGGGGPAARLDPDDADLPRPHVDLDVHDVDLAPTALDDDVADPRVDVGRVDGHRRRLASGPKRGAADLVAVEQHRQARVLNRPADEEIGFRYSDGSSPDPS